MNFWLQFGSSNGWQVTHFGSHEKCSFLKNEYGQAAKGGAANGQTVDSGRVFYEAVFDTVMHKIIQQPILVYHNPKFAPTL